MTPSELPYRLHELFGSFYRDEFATVADDLRFECTDTRASKASRIVIDLPMIRITAHV